MPVYLVALDYSRNENIYIYDRNPLANHLSSIQIVFHMNYLFLKDTL